MSKNLFYIIAALTIFSFAVRIYRIDQPPKYYFDEVYHVPTAEAYANNNPAAYDPFAPPPKPGTAYEWLHPPLAKLIQAGSIKIFGDKPFAWRLPSAIFGTAIIPAVFVLGYLVFGSTVGVFAAAVVAFENLNLVMSRIAMNDIFVTFFVIVSFIFTVLYLRNRSFKNLALVGLSLGLAASSKWTGFYALAGVGGFLLGLDIWRKRFNLRLLFIPTLVGLIYLLSYGQFWLQGHSFQQFIDLNKQIWWYQNRRDLKHPYGTTAIYCVPEGLDGPSTFCPWILDIRPVYFSYEQYGTKAGYIYSLGNPFVFWFGILSISFLISRVIDIKKKEVLLVLLGYFVFWVPWIFSPRILFLHHYLPSIPFMSIAIGYLLATIYSTKYRYLSIVIMAVLIGAFWFFYPISSGFPIPIDWIDHLMWFKSWR